MGLNVSNTKPVLATSNAIKSGKNGIRNFVNTAKDQMVPADKIIIQQDKKIDPMSKGAAKLTGKFANFFSYATVKKFAPVSIAASVGIVGGGALAIFAGPAIHGAFMALAASSVFPPVMIAIGATLGAALLAFGLYKLVQNAKKKVADQELYQKHVSSQKNQNSAQQSPTTVGTANKAKSAQYAGGVSPQKPAKALSLKSESGASTAASASIPPYQPPATVPAPQMANESAEWAK